MGYDRARGEGSAGDLPSVKQTEILERLAAVIVSRLKADPATSYVASLAAKGHDAILKKVAEEAAETLLASKDGDKLHLIHETADLWFHCMVLLAWHGVGPRDVLDELQRREGTSGVAEKKSRL
jgi:phosphoribosyl-ATP pyrophosphohydrolase